eukprot:m.136154 g.136154  ORF g.136154 m.136154 type:complete len:242 (+) comp11428_c3_seq2:265-990(+)
MATPATRSQDSPVIKYRFEWHTPDHRPADGAKTAAAATTTTHSVSAPASSTTHSALPAPPAPPAPYRRIYLSQYGTAPPHNPSPLLERTGTTTTASPPRDDCDSWATRDTIIDSWATLLRTGFPDSAWTCDAISTRFFDHPAWHDDMAVLAVHESDPYQVVAAGLAWLDSVGDDWGRLHWVVVSPDHRRQGLGTWLVQAMLHHHTTAHGVNKVYLRTENYRAAAMSLYTQCGFVKTGVVSE